MNVMCVLVGGGVRWWGELSGVLCVVCLKFSTEAIVRVDTYMCTNQ